MRPLTDNVPLQFIVAWVDGLEPLPLADVAADPARVAVFSVDMLECFTRRGPLASKRAEALIPRIVELFLRAHGLGVRHFVLVEDAHHPESPEFEAFGPHCLQGTEEARTVKELAELPFANEYVFIRKNSLSAAIHTPLDPWLDVHPEVATAIVVGNSTDLCVYQLAAHLRLRADALDLPGYRVIVPANLVDCYDLPVEQALQAGLMPHPAAFFHPVFLYHLRLIGVEVRRELAW